MIFKRRKNQAAEPDEVLEETPVATEPSDDPESEDRPSELDVDALDAADWRTDGPWDVSEMATDAEEDEGSDPDITLDITPDITPDSTPGAAPGAQRIDLGSMLVTGFAGAELRLQVSEESQQVVSVMLISGDSAIELGAYAAPRTGGLWPELRDELTEAATEAGGSAALVEGPFGVELRRLLPVTTPDGEQGYQPSRMWVVEGPRWLLRGIVYGQAALEDGVDGPVAPLLTAFRSVIVRRDAQAMAPGDLLPLELPKDLTASDAS